MRRSRCFCALLGAAAVVPGAFGFVPRTRQLAVFFPALPPAAASAGSAALTDALGPLVAAALDTAAEAVKFTGVHADSKFVKGSFATFALLAPHTPEVVDSDDAGYAEAARAWAQALVTDDALGGGAVQVPGVGDVRVDTARFEAAVPAAFEGDEAFVEGDDPPVNQSSERNDLLAALLTRQEVLQLRIPEVPLAAFTAEPEQLLRVYQGLRRVASSVLGLGETRVVLFDIRPAEAGGAVVQFSVYPSNDAELEAVGGRWTAAVAGRADPLTAAFPQFDAEFEPRAIAEAPATGGWHQGGAAADDDAGSRVDTARGIVAGSVIGGVTALAAIGGAGGYWYRKKYAAGSSADSDELLEYQSGAIAAAAAVDRYGEIDIVDEDDGNSPVLSNVDIGGAAAAGGGARPAYRTGGQ